MKKEVLNNKTTISYNAMNSSKNLMDFDENLNVDKEKDNE